MEQTAEDRVAALERGLAAAVERIERLEGEVLPRAGGDPLDTAITFMKQRDVAVTACHRLDDALQAADAGLLAIADDADEALAGRIDSIRAGIKDAVEAAALAARVPA